MIWCFYIRKIIIKSDQGSVIIGTRSAIFLPFRNLLCNTYTYHRNKKKIISIGGGGFTHETDESLDQFVLSQLSIESFKIGFLPTASKDNQKNVLNLLAEKLKFSKNLKNFMFLLIEKRRIFFVEKIIDSFLKLCAQKRGEVKASLISSKELSETELENISKELSSSTSSTIKFNYKVDKELIGGLKLQLGSFMICLLYKSPRTRDATLYLMPSYA